MFLGDRFRHIDRQKFWLALDLGGGGDGFRGDLAVERAHRHERIDGWIARHVGNLVGTELGDRDLVGIDARLGQDHAQQGDVRLGSADDADVVSREIVDPLDLRVRLLFGALGGKAGRRPQHHDVLAQDGHGLGVGRHFQVATGNGEIGFFGREKRDAFGRPLGRDRLQPNRTSIAGKGLCQGLNQLLVVAPGRADCDPQGDRPKRVIQGARGRAEQQQACGQHQQRIILPLSAPKSGV